MRDLEKAQQYLNRDKLRYMDMLELLRRGSVDVLHARPDGVLLHDEDCDGWFAAADSRNALGELLDIMPDKVDLFVGHETEEMEYVAQRLGKRDGYKCHQSAWMCPTPPQLPAEPKLKRLGEEWAEFASTHYSHSFGDVAYMRGAIERGMLGAFVDGAPAGYVGFHEEGSIGMLEVLPAYRRRGLGELLTLGAVKLAMEQGKYPFGQVVEGNKASLALQHKVGMTVCDTAMYWLF